MCKLSLYGEVLEAPRYKAAVHTFTQSSPLPCYPFHAGGEISFVQDVESTLEAIYRRPVKVPPELLQQKQPLPHRTFLARMLNNLKQVRCWEGGE